MLITRSLATIAFTALIALIVVPGYSAIGMEIQKSSKIIMSPKSTTHPNKQVIEKMHFAVLSYSDHKISFFEIDCPEELHKLLEPYAYSGYMLFQLIGEPRSNEHE